MTFLDNKQFPKIWINILLENTLYLRSLQKEQIWHRDFFAVGQFNVEEPGEERSTTKADNNKDKTFLYTLLVAYCVRDRFLYSWKKYLMMLAFRSYSSSFGAAYEELVYAMPYSCIFYHGLLQCCHAFSCSSSILTNTQFSFEKLAHALWHCWNWEGAASYTTLAIVNHNMSQFGFSHIAQDFFG